LLADAVTDARGDVREVTKHAVDASLAEEDFE
jgi:hypothetical protein